VGAAFGSSVVKAGKRTVSVTGPVGAKITFVVENANGGTKSYNRVVNATTGKATLKIKKNGKFDVYAMYGDSITSLLRITIK
jgi:formylmethanofuran dehydrogenase subunit E